MDKLELQDETWAKFSTLGSGMLYNCKIKKRPNLKLKNRQKQLLGSLISLRAPLLLLLSYNIFLPVTSLFGIRICVVSWTYLYSTYL